MWLNLQFPADLVIFPKENLMENFIFCAVLVQKDWSFTVMSIHSVFNLISNQFLPFVYLLLAFSY